MNKRQGQIALFVRMLRPLITLCLFVCLYSLPPSICAFRPSFSLPSFLSLLFCLRISAVSSIHLSLLPSIYASPPFSFTANPFLPLSTLLHRPSFFSLSLPASIYASPPSSLTPHPFPPLSTFHPPSLSFPLSLPLSIYHSPPSLSIPLAFTPIIRLSPSSSLSSYPFLLSTILRHRSLSLYPFFLLSTRSHILSYPFLLLSTRSHILPYPFLLLSTLLPLLSVSS